MVFWCNCQYLILVFLPKSFQDGRVQDGRIWEEVGGSWRKLENMEDIEGFKVSPCTLLQPGRKGFTVNKLILRLGYSRIVKSLTKFAARLSGPCHPVGPMDLFYGSFTEVHSRSRQ
jgi:hypothetical protein